MIVIWFAESFERKLRPLCSISSLQCNRRATQRWALSSLHRHHHYHWGSLTYSWLLVIGALRYYSSCSFGWEYTKIFQQLSRLYGHCQCYVLTYSDWFTLVALLSAESNTFPAVLSTVRPIFSLIHPGQVDPFQRLPHQLFSPPYGSPCGPRSTASSCNGSPDYLRWSK